jgi:hypothetical protein
MCQLAHLYIFFVNFVEHVDGEACSPRAGVGQEDEPE